MQNQADLFVAEATPAGPRVRTLRRSTDPKTSEEAAESILPKLRPLQTRVLNVLKAFGEATDEELCAHLSALKGSTVRTRRKELVDAGLVVDTGKKGKTSTGRRTIIWRVR